MLLIGDSYNLVNGRLGDALSALQNLDFLVAMDTFLSRPSQLADVVLPRISFAEKDGVYTNLERRIQRLRPAIPTPAGQAQSERWLFGQLAQRLGVAGFDYPDAAAVMDEIAQVVPQYAGLSYARLKSETALTLRSGLESPQPTQLLYLSQEQRGLQWPLPAESGAGVAVLYQDGFPGGKADFIIPQFRAAPATPDVDYPARFVPGRVLLQRDRDTQVAADGPGGRNRIVREERVELNPADAAAWAIAEGDPVEVQTPRGRLAGQARLNAAIPAGAIAATILFGQLAVDLQNSTEPDPMAKTPGLDILPARIVKRAGE